MSARSIRLVAAVLAFASGLSACWASGGQSGPGSRPPAEPVTGTAPSSDAEPQASAPAGSGPRTVQPGAPGQATRTLTTEAAAALDRPRYSEPDVRFMQGMIPHHAQALEMAALIEERTEDRMIRLLGQRIEISQKDEIALMSRWLERRGEPVPEVGAGHAHGMEEGALMPGMLTREQMTDLAAARGAEFDRLFLEYMIQHHQGALLMVAELFNSVGGGQETEIHRFASDVDADQDMEIQRMRAMLAQIPPP